MDAFSAPEGNRLIVDMPDLKVTAPSDFSAIRVFEPNYNSDAWVETTSAVTKINVQIDMKAGSVVGYVDDAIKPWTQQS